ncbi:MAG: serine/threonine protein kinase [Muribaculaceae bacterium]|nr:serine/threonine protein kinase [Muribaculaceae bacterium]
MSSNDFSQALPVGAVLRGGKYDYTVESVLGKGGFGFTYLVSTYVKIENIDVKLFFAVKEHFVSTLSSRRPGSGDVESSQPVRVQVEGSLKDFRSEAKRLKTLSGKSPYIVKVNESFDANNTAYYVMEYIDGQGLNEVIKASGSVSEGQALAWIKAINEAVRTIHEARMTHLDIKPANILFAGSSTGGQRPVLIDFGLAKHYDSSGNATSTLNTVGCSEGYAPIEQYGGLKTFSPTADIYALGATLFTMLTGTKPPTASDADRATLDSEMEKHGVSEGVRHAVLKAMEYKAAQRFQSVADFEKALAGAGDD